MKQATIESDDAILSRLVQAYESYEQSTADSRQEAERDRDYRHGIQWTADEIATLKKRKQPVITVDRIGPKVDFLLGMEASHRTQPRAYPRNPADEEAADAATDALRYVMEDQRWDRTRSECFDAFIVEGSCGVDVRVTEKYEGEMCVEILPIMWDRMWGDSHSRLRNFSDGNVKGQFLWMDLEDAQQKYPDKGDALEATISGESTATGDTFGDVPRTRWADPKRKRVRIVEAWTKEAGKVFYTAYTKAGILERMESPYQNEDGEPDDGFVFGSCNVDRDGNRFGVVRRWVSLQDEINKRRSKALHLMSVRQTYGNQLSGDKNKLRNELAKPDGHVEMEGAAKFGEDFGVIPTADMAASQFQLAQDSKNDIDSVGVNAALSGNEGRVMSGRALMARSEQGLNELGPVFDAFKQFQSDVYRAVWNRVKQFWTAEKWVRVTDDEKNMKFIGLNQPMTLGEQLLDEMRKEKRQVTPEMQQQAKMDPRMQQVVGVKNNIGKLDVDIVLDDVPHSASLQGEQFETLAKIAPQAASMPPALFKALIRASTLKNKDQILEELEGTKDQESPEVLQMKQQIQAMEEALKAAEEKLKDQSINRDKVEADMLIAAYKAVTERSKLFPPADPMMGAAISAQTAQQALSGELPDDGGNQEYPEQEQLEDTAGVVDTMPQEESFQESMPPGMA